jgi:hypothetical protein
LDGGSEPSDEANIWVVNRERSGWGEPRPIGSPINGNGSVSGPSATMNGTLYFAQWQPDGRELVMRSELMNGEYQTPEALPGQVNTSRSQFHFSVSPDERYLIIPLGGRADVIGSGMNYYVAFRSADGRWSELINLGEIVNSGKSGAFPSISADGKYFFYQAKPTIEFVKSQIRPFTYADLKQRILSEPAYDRGAIFWVETTIIEELRPEGLDE